MNKNSKTVVNSTPGAGNYASPAMMVVEIATEGVLCSSLTDGSEGGFGDLEDGGDLF